MFENIGKGKKYVQKILKTIIKNMNAIHILQLVYMGLIWYLFYYLIFKNLHPEFMIKDYINTYIVNSLMIYRVRGAKLPVIRVRASGTNGMASSISRPQSDRTCLGLPW